ncbi:unnamed protein product [Alopecurus aequalis]
MDSKIFYAAIIVALVAVSSFAGVAYAAYEPAATPGPDATSGATALSSLLFAASILCLAVALLFANLRR